MSHVSGSVIVADANLIAACGLYCGACGAYLKGKCPGCKANVKATWCQVRSCCHEQAYASCADCRQKADAKDCRKFNNFMSKLFGLLFGSDRGACIARIKADGYPAFAQYMAENKLQALKR